MAPVEDRPGLDGTQQRRWDAFLQSAAQLVEASDRELLKAHQITLFDFLVLDFLVNSRGGSAGVGDLAQAFGVGPTWATQQMRRLEERGVVRRSRGMNDRRRVITSVTPEGRARLRPAAQTLSRSIFDALQH